MLLLLHPQPTLYLIRAVMFHDTPEERFGDIPSPALWASDALRVAYENAHEAYLEKEFGISCHLTDEETDWLNCLDKLEAFYFAQHQMKLGNYYFQEVMTNILRWFNDHDSRIPAPVRQIIETLQDEIVNGG